MTTSTTESTTEPRDGGFSLSEVVVAVGLFTLLTLLITVTTILCLKVSANLTNRTDNATQGRSRSMPRARSCGRRSCPTS